MSEEKKVDKRRKKPKEGVTVLKIKGVEAEIDTVKTTALAEELVEDTNKSIQKVLGDAFKDHPEAEEGPGEKIKPSDFD